VIFPSHLQLHSIILISLLPSQELYIYATYVYIYLLNFEMAILYSNYIIFYQPSLGKV